MKQSQVVNTEQFHYFTADTTTILSRIKVQHEQKNNNTEYGEVIGPIGLLEAIIT